MRYIFIVLFRYLESVDIFIYTTGYYNEHSVKKILQWTRQCYCKNRFNCSGLITYWHWSRVQLSLCCCEQFLLLLHKSGHGFIQNTCGYITYLHAYHSWTLSGVCWGQVRLFDPTFLLPDSLVHPFHASAIWNLNVQLGFSLNGLSQFTPSPFLWW